MELSFVYMHDAKNTYNEYNDNILLQDIEQGTNLQYEANHR